MKTAQVISRAAGEASRHIIEDLDDSLGTDAQSSDKNNGGKNLGTLERDISIAAGAILGIVGLKKAGSLTGLALLGLGGALIYRGIKGNCPLYDKLGFSTAGHSEGEPSAAPEEYNSRGIHVEQSITIDKPAAELFRFWRNFENLPRFMDHLKDVKVTDSQHSHWVAKAPLGASVQWDAEIINEEPDKLIAWRSTGDADVDNSGTVRFLPAGDNGNTIVKVTLDYIPPAGKLGAWVAKLFGEEPDQQISDDLAKLKQVIEQGEAVAV
ncbi:MAG: DUF2892 domain-containing protein [Burkholderiales bacterium]|nr:DUF2892 domain-containing protein [Phycisphaerae bacterium]